MLKLRLIQIRAELPYAYLQIEDERKRKKFKIKKPQLIIEQLKFLKKHTDA